MGGGGWSTGGAADWTSGHWEVINRFTERTWSDEGLGKVDMAMQEPSTGGQGTSLEAVGVKGEDEFIPSSTCILWSRHLVK